ncbi:MAG: serine hydrolase [Roseiflexaceae bacterium]|nr:serine hydrolase [Roseiflexaceae bacterium]
MQAVTTDSSTDLAAAPREHFGYLPGLDGLRALAVIAVLCYHAGLNVYGGYLGVESFFAISGFLITSLLLHEWERHGKLDLVNFWMRRARRLLPALFLVLAATLLASAILLPETMSELSSATVAAVVYLMNWFLIVTQQSYFDAVERPPLLQHLWSLAIEEQFYLLWPLLVGLGLRVLHKRGLLIATLLAVAASFAAMLAQYDPGADPSRVYYGTDTRAAGLLVGAALALVWSPEQAAAASRRRAIMYDVVGILGLATLIIAYLLLNDQLPLMYRGGFLFVSIITTLIIAVATHPAARATPRVLELAPLRWVGQRSYGLYLWHWPIFQLTRPGIDLPFDDWLVQVLRFGLAFGLAALSYTLVEQPIRQGALGQVWGWLRTRRAATGTAPARWSAALATILLLLGISGVAAGITQGAISTARAERALVQAQAEPEIIQPNATPSAPAATAAAAPAANAPTSQADATVEPTAQPEAAFDPALAERLQAVLDAAVADGAIPGATLSVQLPDGSNWTGASGLADRAAGTPMQPDTLVRVGSLSKMFTAVAVLQLAEAGTVDLDAPVATYLPDLLPNGDAITVRNLLQHTSGLYDYLEDRRFVTQAYSEPARVWTPRELVDYATQFPSSFAPGTEGSWDYSNTNYVILGMLVEQVSGNALAQELAQRIFTPLELAHTFSVTDTIEGAQARGYSRDDDQTDVAFSVAFGTANIVTTAGDLRRFGSALVGGELLQPASLAQMQQFVDGKGQYDMPDLGYGLGLMSNRLLLAGQDTPLPVIGHIGGFGGFRAALWYAPERQALVALSVNQTAVDPNDLAAQVMEIIAE